MDDAELLTQVAAGDRAALRTLYECHAPWLTLRLERRCSDRAMVEEVLQDTFVAVWRSADRYRGDGPVGAWLWGIAIRRLLDRLRRRSLTTVSLGTHDEAVGSAEDAILVGVEHGDLAAVLNDLSPELRAVVQATVLDGLTTREAGELLGVPAGTVKSRMARARQQMRQALA